jgi:hypothetical protein
VAASVLCLFWALEGASAYENANVVMYMANEEGRSAWGKINNISKQRNYCIPAEAFHIPALNNSMKKR